MEPIKNEEEYRAALAELEALWKRTPLQTGEVTEDDRRLDHMAERLQAYERTQCAVGTFVIYPQTGRIGRVVRIEGGTRHAQFGKDSSFTEQLLPGRYREATAAEVANPEKAAKDAVKNRRKR